MGLNIDLAVIELENNQAVHQRFPELPTTCTNLTEADKNTKIENVELISKNYRKKAFIQDFDLKESIKYNNVNVLFNNLIRIGTSANPNNSNRLTVEGDSGACVVKLGTNELIGILIGGCDKFSHVLPIHEFLDNNSFKII
jgi:hypothetical protein